MQRFHSHSARLVLLLILAVLVCASAVTALCLGAYRIPPADVWRILTGDDSLPGVIVIRELRLPRVILGLLSGAALGVSGTILQGMLRNPLASPGILGVSAGGGLAGIVLLLIFPAHAAFLPPTTFAGSLLTALLVYLLAWKRGIDPIRLILAGCAVSAMLGAFSSTILLTHADRAGSVLDFMLGSLANRAWPQIYAVLPYFATGFLAAGLLANPLNVLLLGDESAASLGLRVERTRLFLLTTAALLAAASVSVAGLLGFVGLIAPHMVRLIIGSDHRFLLPGSALTGAFLVVSCDTVGRLAALPSELPAGMLMALLGPPFFLWLLREYRHET